MNKTPPPPIVAAEEYLGWSILLDAEHCLHIVDRANGSVLQCKLGDLMFIFKASQALSQAYAASQQSEGT